MKLLFVGDIHLSDRPPSTRREGYAQEILVKLAEVGVIAQEQGVAAVVCAGDVFHSKVPSRTSHALVQRAMSVFRSMRKPVWVVPGNHDYAGANVEELKRSPLGVLAGAGVVSLFGTPEQRSVRLPPPPTWVTMFGVREEESIEIFSEPQSPEAAALVNAKGVDVIVAHSAIFPPGSTPPFDHFPAEEVAARTGVPLVLYGHIHEPHGVYDCNGVRFVNPGALSRGSMFEEAPQRIPQVAVVDVLSGEVELIPLSRSTVPWTEVFRITEEYAKRDRSLAAADFAQELMAATVDVFDVERVIAALRSREDVSTRVRERAVSLVESV